eukprot:scaffold1465_cov383-Prasinococcus_capsulatus_cf.AAC.6
MMYTNQSVLGIHCTHTVAPARGHSSLPCALGSIGPGQTPCRLACEDTPSWQACAPHQRYADSSHAGSRLQSTWCTSKDEAVQALEMPRAAVQYCTRVTP